MRRVRLRASAIAVLALCLFASGCVSAVRRPASAPAITLSSQTAVRLMPANAVGAPCAVRRAELQVTAVRADTIFFLAATPLKWPNAGPRCAVDGDGWIDVAAHPDLKVERPEHGGRVGFLYVAYATLALFGVGMFLLVLGSWGWGQ